MTTFILEEEPRRKNTDNYQYKYVSIIVPALNEEHYIRKCLESLVNLRYPMDCYEIIIVDNGSTDNTVAICKDYTQSVYVCHGLSVAGLRNYGAKKAKGNIYAFIDGDCVADEGWLENAIKSINIETCVTGAYCEIPSEATWIEKTWSLRRPNGRREIQHIGTGNLIVPADIFNKIGGFDSSLTTGEDYEFCIRAKNITKIILDDSIKVTHYGNPKTIKQFIRREIWHGLGALGSLKIQKLDKPLIGTIAFSILFFLQIFSLLYILSYNGSKFLFYNASAGVILLLILTIYHQNRRSGNIFSWFKLLLLFYMYYFSRSISLFYILLNKNFKRKR